MTFDTIKRYAMTLLEAAAKGEDTSYEIDGGDLPPYYKEMIEKTFRAVINDDELKELYRDINPVEEKNE